MAKEKITFSMDIDIIKEIKKYADEVFTRDEKGRFTHGKRKHKNN